MSRNTSATSPLSRRQFLRLTGAAASLALLAACGPGSPPAPTTTPAAAPPPTSAPAGPPTTPAAVATTAPVAAPEPSSLTVALTDELTGFDPGVAAYTLNSLMIEAHVLENLVDIQGQELKVTPVLAESWRTLDPTTWEFKLRPGVKWHNGDEFTAEDVRWTIERLADPKSPRANLVAHIAAVETPNPSTVVLKTKAPYGPMIAQLTDVPILPKRAFEAMGAEEFARRPVGTGPYKLVEWVRDQRLVLEANPSWWRGSAAPRQLILRPITDPSTRVAELRSGGVQIIQSVPAAELDSLDQGDTRVVVISEGRLLIYPFNLSTEPFSDVRVRQAIVYGTDRPTIVKTLLGKYGTLMSGTFTSKWFGYNPAVQPYPYDPERAKQLLAEAGQSNLEFDWNITNGVFLKDREVAETIASQLRRVGVKVNLVPTERNKLSQDYKAGKFQLHSTAWGTRTDPHPMLSWITDSPAYTDAQVKQFVQDGASTVDEDKRRVIYQQIHKRMADEAHWLPVYAQAELFARRRNVAWEGQPTHGSLAMHLFYTVQPR